VNISPYLLGLIGISLLVYREFLLGSALLIISIGEISFPNLNSTNTPQAFYIRLGFITVIVSLIAARLLQRFYT
jgi:hypothetical protein